LNIVNELIICKGTKSYSIASVKKKFFRFFRNMEW